MKDNNNYSDSDWNELASMLSGEGAGRGDLLKQFVSGDDRNVSEQWKVLEKINKQDEIDVDKAWSKLSSRLRFAGDEPAAKIPAIRLPWGRFLRIAAAVLLLTGIGTALLLIGNKGDLPGRKTIATGKTEVNLMVKLPDGSTVYLNRNTKLSYKIKQDKTERSVRLTGEAFFYISPDASRPFIVDAGKAKVKVLGTSFNVITGNTDGEVEVFVKTGRVLMADSAGVQSVVLDPGFIGTMGSGTVDKKVNENQNYMSWNTGKLTYNGQKLDVMFRDLEKIYNIRINTSDSSIFDLPITATFNNEQPETIIRIICNTFDLTYRQDGNIYHLGKK